MTSKQKLAAVAAVALVGWYLWKKKKADAPITDVAIGPVTVTPKT